MSKNLTNKPLKGASLSANSGVFDNLQVNNISLPAATIDSLVNGVNLVGVTMIDSEIQNTVIGVNGPNEGHFTTLTSTNDITFQSLDGTSSVSWDSINSVFNIHGYLNTNNCATISNFGICRNTIQALNANGDIILLPKGTGGLYFNGPISNIVNSQGNYLTSLANGNVTFIASDYINLVSQSSSSSITSFSDQTFTTVNGDFTFNTDTGIGQKLILSIYVSHGNTLVSTGLPSNVTIGDLVNLSSTNSVPPLNGTFKVTNIINNQTFAISTANTLITNATTGILYKPPSNNINLNASAYVNIPTNIPLTFSNTTNSISGNSAGLLFNTNADVVYNTLLFQIPQTTKFQLGTSGNNYMNFDGSALNLASTNNIDLNSYSLYLNASDIYLKDSNPLFSNNTQSSSDISDRGLQFNYYDSVTNTTKLGWFGYKKANGKFTLLTDATNNNEVFTGTLGKFDIGDVSSTSITISPGGVLDVNCGTLKNVNTITGCGNVLNINASNTVNITTASRIAFISGGDIYIPSNIPITIGTAGSSIKENTSANLILTASNNTYLNTQTNGSIIIQPNVKLSFDGTSIGNSRISSSNGNFDINGNGDIRILTTSGNVVIPENTNLKFGTQGSTQTIYGNTSGIYLNSLSTLGSITQIATSNINLSSSFGNIQLYTKTGDIQLFTTSGNTRLYQDSSIIFSISGTSNSIKSNSNGNLIINGPGNVNGNSIQLTNTNVINLNASKSVNIPTNVQVDFDTENTRFIITDTTGNFNLINSNSTSGNINLTSLNLNISNSTGTTTIINNNTNITTQSFVISGTTGSTTLINTENVKLSDPILTLANNNNTFNDNKDRGIEYKYYSNSTGSTKLGWFGYKNSTGQFTYYSEAINTNEVITGTLGQFALGSIVVNQDLSFITTGNINMNCGTISNLNTIIGCGGKVNVIANSFINLSTPNILLNANTAGKVLIPTGVPLSFGTTDNSISSDSLGNIILTANDGTGTFILNANLQVNGITENVFSTITNIQDPIISIGGVNGPNLNDLKNRGVEFKWYGTRNNTTGSKTGFFGFDNTTQRFVYIPDGLNTNEVFTGQFGDVQFSKGYFDNLNVNCGTVSNVSLLTGCSNQGLNISSNNVLLSPPNSKLLFGSTNNSISTDTLGNFNIYSLGNSSGILLNTNFVQIPQNTPLYFGSQSSGNFITHDTSGNFNINNSSGDIYLTPHNDVTTGTSGNGNVIIPTNNNLIFGNSSTRIVSDGTNLQLYGYSIGINSTTTITFNGNVNVAGNITSTSKGDYIYPLGSKQQLTITKIENSTTTGSVIVTVAETHYLVIGDKVTLTSTDSIPSVNGDYIVNKIISSNKFSINATITNPGTTGVVYGVLKVYQGKDVGIEVDYWSNTDNPNVTAGSVNYKTAFFGWMNDTHQWTYFNNATISNNNVTNGILGDIRVNEIYADKISGFTLDGVMSGGNNLITGTNFEISGGIIDNTRIGQNTAQAGRFTALSSTTETSLENVTFQSNISYSTEYYQVDSLNSNRNPLPNKVISYVTVFGYGFIGTGTMPVTGLTDGQVKKIICISINPESEYRLSFPTGKLIASNPLGGPAPTLMTFKRAGQSCELTWSNELGAWMITGGRGAYIS